MTWNDFWSNFWSEFLFHSYHWEQFFFNTAKKKITHLTPTYQNVQNESDSKQSLNQFTTKLRLPKRRRCENLNSPYCMIFSEQSHTKQWSQMSRLLLPKRVLFLLTPPSLPLPTPPYTPQARHEPRCLLSLCPKVSAH